VAQVPRLVFPDLYFHRFAGHKTALTGYGAAFIELAAALSISR
jgi:hypothetical protein